MAISHVERPLLMSPDRFTPFDNRTDVSAVARDERMRLLWCNAAYAATFESTPDALRGSGMDSLFSRAFVEERSALVSPAIERQTVVAYDQVVRGSRYLTRVWPLNPDAFGVRGCFVVAEPCSGSRPVDASVPFSTASEADLGNLGAMTRRELEIFRLLAEGLTGQEIATVLHRSHKTVEFHTARILHTLGKRSRTELARFAAERGLMGFSRDSWFRIAHGRLNGSRRPPAAGQKSPA
jgi:DNA-binding CsgD family transcriptional regulator